MAQRQRITVLRATMSLAVAAVALKFTLAEEAAGGIDVPVMTAAK
jgi:hypothetical protein